jgi:hypothetical protein
MIYDIDEKKLPDLYKKVLEKWKNEGIVKVHQPSLEEQVLSSGKAVRHTRGVVPEIKRNIKELLLDGKERTNNQIAEAIGRDWATVKKCIASIPGVRARKKKSRTLFRWHTTKVGNKTGWRNEYLRKVHSMAKSLCKGDPSMSYEHARAKAHSILSKHKDAIEPSEFTYKGILIDAIRTHDVVRYADVSTLIPLVRWSSALVSVVKNAPELEQLTGKKISIVNDEIRCSVR